MGRSSKKVDKEILLLVHIILLPIYAIFFLAALSEKMPKANKITHRKRNAAAACTGNCASCPPHYGYRYGRWYYGHDHVHGCELGGNKCSGSMDYK